MIRKSLAVAVLVLCCTGALAETISGAGATFPYPLYASWFDTYQKAHKGVGFNYRPVGSGQGIREIVSGTLDFGASDGPMTGEQLAEAQAKLGTSVLHFPTVLGADVPIYNVPGVRGGLRFTPEVLSGIFLGSIKTWNDPEILKSNPGIGLPENHIVVIHRSDGSGTTYCWTDYLSTVSPEWKRRVGKGTEVAWPVGLAAKGSERLAGLVKQTPYSLGYVELAYAMQNRIPFGRVRNAAGNFIWADLASVSAAAAGAARGMPDHFRVSITNPPGRDAYPIATFTWLLIPAQPRPGRSRKALLGFLAWALSEGQKTAGALGYAPLPKEIVARELKVLSTMR
jgi:phosphate transport system substrate-binding protein